MTTVHTLVDKCKDFFSTRMDYWAHTTLTSRGDILCALAQLDTGHSLLAADYHLVAGFYASVLPTDFSVDYHVLQLRALVDDYNPSVRYTFFQEQIHGSVPYLELPLSRDERRLLRCFDRFTLRYPNFDYQQFFEGYFPAATKISSSHPPGEVIPFPGKRTA